MMIGSKDKPGEIDRADVQGGLSMAIGIGLVSASVLAVVGLVAGAGNPIRSALWVFALVMPFLLIQDATRYVFFRQMTPRVAA